MYKNSIVVACSTVAVVGFCWILAQSAQADPNVAPHLLARAAMGAGAQGGASGDAHAYVGTRGCKKCHSNYARSWKTTPHASAFDVLKPGERAEAKTKAGLDTEKDYTTDAKCLPCHTTGYGKPGGYVIPDMDDKKSVRAAKKLENIGCEMCHGPGEKYAELFSEILKSGRKYKTEELRALGLAEISESTCTACHNKDNPTYKPFDYEERLKVGVHDQHPLKQRKE